MVTDNMKVKYFELKFLQTVDAKKGLRNLIFCDIDLHIFLNILNAKK